MTSLADRLRDAATAAGRGDAVSTIEALLDAWRECAAPEIAAVLERTTAAAQRDPAPDWQAAAEADDVVERPRLIARLRGLTPTEALASLATLRASADPRVAAEIVALVESPPFLTQASKPFWVALFQLLVAARDPRASARLRAPLQLQPRTRLIEWMGARLEVIAAKLPQAGTLPPSLSPALEEVQLDRARVRQRAPGRAAPSSTELLRLVYESPDDDGPRAILADHLQERGDPRGEFIALQLALARGSASEAAVRRQMTLLRKHYKAWLGEITRVLEFPGAPAVGAAPAWSWEKQHRWHRGFLAGATLRLSAPRLASLIGAPGWASLDEVTLWGERSGDLVRSLRGLRAVHQAMPDQVAAIDAVPAVAERIEQIECYLHDESIERVLATTTAWPSLRRLHANCQTGPSQTLQRLIRRLGESRLDGLKLSGMFRDIQLRRDGDRVVIEKDGGPSGRRLLTSLGLLARSP